MTTITNNVVNTVKLTDENSYTETFIFNNEQNALQGVHAAMLIALASTAVDQRFTLTGLFLCKYNEQFVGKSAISVNGDKILIADTVNEFTLDALQAHTYILEPFGLFMPDFVPSIDEQVFGVEGLTCWLLEDLTGYYTGQDSDLWILTSQGMLIATEELHREDEGATAYLSPIAVFDLTHQWTPEEVKESTLIKDIVQHANVNF